MLGHGRGAVMGAEESKQDEQVESAEASAKVVCKECGAPIEDKASFCMKCGAEAPAAPLTFQGLPEWWKKAAIGLAGLTVLGVLLSALWPSGTPAAREEEPPHEPVVAESKPSRTLLPRPPIPRPKPKEQADEPSPTGDWNVRTEVSPLDDVTTVTLDLRGEDPQDAQARTPYATQLSFLCSGDHIEGYVFVRRPPESDRSARATVRMRFDSLDAQQSTMERSVNDDALFFGKPAEMLKRMLGHERLLFGYTPRGSGEAVTSFELRGLREAIKPMVDGCKVPDLAAALAGPETPDAEPSGR